MFCIWASQHVLNRAQWGACFGARRCCKFICSIIIIINIGKKTLMPSTDNSFPRACVHTALISKAATSGGKSARKVPLYLGPAELLQFDVMRSVLPHGQCDVISIVIARLVKGVHQQRSHWFQLDGRLLHQLAFTIAPCKSQSWFLFHWLVEETNAGPLGSCCQLQDLCHGWGSVVHVQPPSFPWAAQPESKKISVLWFWKFK